MVTECAVQTAGEENPSQSYTDGNPMYHHSNLLGRIYPSMWYNSMAALVLTKHFLVEFEVCFIGGIHFKHCKSGQSLLFHSMDMLLNWFLNSSTYSHRLVLLSALGRRCSFYYSGQQLTQILKSSQGTSWKMQKKECKSWRKGILVMKHYAMWIPWRNWLSRFNRHLFSIP